MNSQLLRLRGLLLGGFFLALAAAFLSWHLDLPSDGARLEPGEQVWKPNGILVTPLEDGRNPLRPGDIVIAVDGRTMEAWAEAIFQPGFAQWAPTIGRTLTYTVLRDGRRIDLTLSPVPYPLQAILARNWSTLLFTFFTQLVMTIVFFLRPHDRPARTLFLWAFSLSHTYAWALGLQVPDILNGVGFWLYQVSASGAWLVFWSAGLEFVLVYPRIHPLLERRPWLVPLNYLSSFLIFLIYLLFTLIVSPTRLNWLGTWILGNWLVATLFIVLSMYFVFDGYHSTRDSTARKKVRWLFFAFLLCSGTGLVLWFVPGLVMGRPLIDANALGLSLLPFPIILAISVLRYQLFDIDVIIHRTLIYTVLTAVLAFVYWSSVVLLQQVFRALTGQQSDIAIIISTLAIAVLFNPLRHRVQNVIDQSFYRRKYDAAKVLAAFGATVRDEVELSKLTDQLLEVVDETMQPVQVSLWLREAGPKRE